jgi:ABC-type phosphate transport system substrate-binding protein
MVWAAKTVAVLLVVALVALTTGHAATSEGQPSDDYQIIVHPSNPQRVLGRAFLRGVYLKKNTTWPSGETIRPVGLGKRYPARERFAREVLNKSPAQLRAYWNQQIFSGKGVPPPEYDSEAAVIAFVTRNRGAVGFLPAAADPGGAVTVTIK